MRLIPAHAGKTCCSTIRGRTFPAHPRSRGENTPCMWVWGYVYGSSPLTRGKQAASEADFWAAGLIPAHAGKTVVLVLPRSTSPAHPRSRGENGALLSGIKREPGSSPLTRGKLPDARLDRERGGLIPAHAGKTRARGQGGGRPGAHPRSRGENKRGLTWLRPTAGSSPLTRGKRSNPRTGRSPRRLIPAHAGKTWPGSSRVIDIAAHPRSRGENEHVIQGYFTCHGSSPLTRGKHLPAHWLAAYAGLIPAHAGKTTCPPGSSVATSAHPRSRGENSATKPR